RYMSALATCAQIAPFVGLLGTVAGMIKAFAQIHNKQGQVNPSDLAEGISNALVTTVGGLTVAIPALVMFNYFQTRVNNLILEMEISSSELIELLTKERDGYEI
ncbi:MAG: MotA/TolQ/ExbB proton channel family protein, partial [Candidatus Hydrogenedentales bacterium]